MRLVASFVRHFGVLSVWRFLHRHSIVILTIHGVGADDGQATWVPLRARLSPDRLDYTLKVLRRRYRFVSMEDATEMLSGRRPVEPYSMVLTFDDGYRNAVASALPVLQRHGVRPVVFVSTGPVTSRRSFWFDRLDYALQQGNVDGRVVVIGGRPMTIAAGNRQQLAASYAELRRAVKSPERDDREMAQELDQLTSTLEAESGRSLDAHADDPWSAVLTAEEIRASADRVSFGSHTVDHLRVHRLPLDILERQLNESKAAMESWTAQRCRFFCYPDGGVDPVSANAVRRSGYDAAVTTIRGVNRAGDDLMMLRRIDVPLGGTADELLVAASGLADVLHRRLRPLLRIVGRRA
jgi:peptidoglycan/xylan/chitin deacetylase (PgdA/CDA1 family)